jgi:hypothetical protein
MRPATSERNPRDLFGDESVTADFVNRAEREV